MAGNHEAPGSHRRKRKRSGSGHKILIICLVLLLIAAIGVIVWLVSKSGNGPGSSTEPEATAQAPPAEHGGLVVPERPEMIDNTAYESLELKADTLEQSVRFDNPLPFSSPVVTAEFSKLAGILSCSTFPASSFRI